MNTPINRAENSVLFFFFPRSHRLPVGSLYGGIIGAASLLGVDSILLRFGSIGSISSILTLAKLRAIENPGAETESIKSEERPIVAARLDWRLLRWLIHVIASPFQLFTTVYSRKPKRILVRDLPHAAIAAPIAKIFGVPLLFVADSRAWDEIDQFDPLTGRRTKRPPSLIQQWRHSAATKAVALLSTIIIVPSHRLRAVFTASDPAAAAKLEKKVVVSWFPLLLPDEPPAADAGKTGLLRQHSFPEDSFLIVADISENNLRTIELFIRSIHALNLPQVTVLLLGEIVERERIRSLITGFGLRDSVHLTGWVDSPAAVYGFADLVISLPSAAGIGASALGAIRVGIPVAALDDLDGQETFGHNSGLYRNQHVEYFSSWLRDLILNTDEIDNLRRVTASRGRELAALEKEKMLKVFL